MEKVDSSQALMSLVGDYGDDVEEDAEVDDDPEGIDNISGSDDEALKPTRRVPLFSAAVREKRQALELPDEAQPHLKLERKAPALVSYVPDDIDEDADDADEDRLMEEKYDVSSIEMINVTKDPSFNADMAAILSRSVQNMEADDIKLPPEPQGKCSKKLQEKILKYYDKRESYENGQGRYTGINESIQQRKDFRNPSIYEKLINFIEIDEKGTNYPPEIYDPTIMGPESFYDELAKIQKVEMDKREKDKKDRTKIEFVTVTKKIDAPEPKRKSKWDAQPAVVTGVRPTVVPPTILNPSVISVSATGTKTTVISAVGTIAKKSSK